MAELIMLRLEGMFQSWGEDAKWDTRPSAAMPTKSGIVGLIACAMGLERGNPEILALSEHLTVGVRADRSGTMFSEYQTVQGMPRLYCADGKKRRGNTIVSSRQYLQDASFLVVLETDAVWRERIRAAFSDPQWPVCLGRKNCVPSRPVWEGICGEYADIMDALEKHPTAGRPDKLLHFEVESPREDCGAYSRPDEMAGRRTFRKRRVWHGVWKGEHDVSDEN